MQDIDTLSPSSDLSDKIELLLRPRSVLIYGASVRPGTAGQAVLRNFLRDGYKGDIYLYGRSPGNVDGHDILTDLASVPEGVDLVVLVVPGSGLQQAIAACIGRGVRSGICFASGFAELGEEGRRQQQEVADLARAAGFALIGPNTIGYYNSVDNFNVMMVELDPLPQLAPDAGSAVAVVAQSGGMGTHISGALLSRAVPLSYVFTTGNEAVMGASEIIHHLAQDSRTLVIALYAEHIAAPDRFLAAVREATAAGKRVIMLHPGRSEKGQAAASSHTGALASNHAAMVLAVEEAGAIVVETMEEWLDMTQLLFHFPDSSPGGVAVMTASGALCAVTEDYADALGLSIPELGEAQAQMLAAVLPDFLPPRNPLDLGTSIAWDFDLIGHGAKALLADPGIGSLLVSVPMGTAPMHKGWVEAFIRVHRENPKPSIFVFQSEGKPLAPELHALAADNKVILMRSNERALRTLARFGRFSAKAAETAARPEPRQSAEIPAMAQGPQAEWFGKQIFRSIGIAVPEGRLARTADEAVLAAEELGYPVVMKVQSAALPHKSEVGGVMLHLSDESSVRAAWKKLHDNVERARPGLELDGVLVEAMGAAGLELVVGATRDPQWGPVMMVGLGGVWVEALADVRIMPPTLSREAIVGELGKLKASKLLNGFRGSEPVDVEAVADTVQTIANLMLTTDEISEIDVNPLIVYPRGQGVIALDALIVADLRKDAL